MRILITSILIFFVCLVSGQNTANLSSANGKAFKVLMEGKLLHPTYQAHVVIDKISKDTLALEVEFENKKKFPITIYLLEKGVPCKNKEFNYLVEFDNTSLSLRFTGINELRPLPEPLVPTKPVIDTTLKYQNKILSHFCELKDGKPVFYNNIPKEGTCVTPMLAEYMNYTAILMSKVTVEANKYQLAENICRNNCLSVNQFITLLNYIPYELEKLKLIRIGYFNLTDPENIKLLEKNFKFEASVKELNDFVKNSASYKLKGVNTCSAAASHMLVDKFSERLSVYSNDAERFESFKKGYSDLCYSTTQITVLLSKFIHDREKLEAAKLLYFNCVEKEKYSTLSFIFSYNQTAAELKDFVEKQTK